jgi:hypothetical protein
MMPQAGHGTSHLAKEAKHQACPGMLSPTHQQVEDMER